MGTLLVGLSTPGARADSGVAGRNAVSKFTATTSGNASILKGILGIANPLFTEALLEIYSHDAANDAPLTLLGYANADVLAAAQGTGVFQATLPTPVPITAGTTYWLGWRLAGEVPDWNDTASGRYMEAVGVTPPTTWVTASGPFVATLTVWAESAPIAIQAVPISFTRQSGIASRTSAAFDALAGDLITVRAMNEDSSTNSLTVSNNGVALTWVLTVSDPVGSNVGVWVWTCVLPADRTGLTVTITSSLAGAAFGGRVKTWRNSGGAGVSAVANGTTAPTITLTGVGASSAIDAECGDWNAGTATASWGGTVAPVSEYAQQEAAAATFYMGSVADAGAAGNKVVSMASVPAGATTRIAAIEIKAAATGGAPSPPRPLGTVRAQAITRAASR